MGKRRKNTITRFLEDIVDDTKDFVDDILDRAKDLETDARDAVKDAIDDDDDEVSVSSPSSSEMKKIYAALEELTSKVNELSSAQSGSRTTKAAA